MNFNELLKTLEAIDKGQQVDEFLGFGKKKEQPAPATPQGKPPTSGQPPAPANPQDKAGAAADAMGGGVGNAVDAIKKRQQILKDLEERRPEPDEDDYEPGHDEDEADYNRRSREEDGINECGSPMMGGMGEIDSPKQADSVTMNVSMNGSGAGGIRDLLNVLKDIQDGPSDDMSGDDMDISPDMDAGHDMDMDPGADQLLKKNVDSMADMIDDDFANSMAGDEGPETIGIDAVTEPPSNDIHSPAGKVAHTKDPAYVIGKGEKGTMTINPGDKIKVNGPLKLRLESLYQEILSRDLTEGSGPKEKQKTPYRDINSPEYRKAADKQKEKMAKDKAAEPGKALARKIKAK